MDSVAVSPSGQYLATAHWDFIVRVWDASGRSTLTQARKLTGHTRPVMSVAWSPDSTRIVSGSMDGTMRVWDAATGSEVGKVEGHDKIRPSQVTWVAFSPDGTRIGSAATDYTMRLWDAINFLAMLKLEAIVLGIHRTMYGGAFSPCSTKVVSRSSDGVARVWDTTSGKELLRLSGHTAEIVCVAYSPCGTRIASGDTVAHLWDATTGELLRTLECQAEWVRSVAFSPSDGGARLVTGSSDKTVRVWDTNTGASLLTLEGHTHESVTSVVFSPDGSSIFSVSYDNTIRKWDSRTGQAALVVDFVDSDISLLTDDIKNGTVTEALLAGKQLTDRHLAAIGQALATPGCVLREFNIRNCKLTPEGTVALAEALKVNASLKEMDLGGTYGFGDAGAAAFAEALKINYALTWLFIAAEEVNPIEAQLIAALAENENPVTRQEKKLAFEMRLQREGLAPPAKVGRWLA